MTRYVCLLRGVNVSGQRKVDMKALQRLFVDLGHEDVSTYIQSGNVVFTAAKGRPAALAKAIEERLAADLHVDPSALLRSRDELAAVVDANPFLAEGADQGADPATLHVTFFAAEPDAGRLADVDPAAFEPDRFHLAGREVYLHCPNGYGRTKLNNAFWERRSGVGATTRNWKTVTKLLALAGGPGR
jgi:uncharacterized protein (DUF1697 family)